jgi:heptosyltransferase-2
MTQYLVVGPSWVGDMVMAQSLFTVLKRREPHCRISVLAPAWTEPVLARIPEVDHSLSMPIGHGRMNLGTRWRLGRELRDRYDHAIVLPGSFKSAMVPLFAGIKKRTGFIGEQRYGLLNDRRKLDKARMPYHLQRVVSLGEPVKANPTPLEDIPWPQIETDKDNQRKNADAYGLMLNQPTVALCPGAEFGPAKQWPASYFAEVAKNRLNAGWQVMIMGSDKDRNVADTINKEAPGSINLAGKTDLGDAIDLMAIASHVVTNDSGLMHIAAALDCAVIAIYGSSTDAYTPPLSKKAQRLYLDLECRPCFKRTCPLGHLDCLKKLPASRVIELF